MLRSEQGKRKMSRAKKCFSKSNTIMWFSNGWGLLWILFLLWKSQIKKKEKTSININKCLSQKLFPSIFSWCNLKWLGVKDRNIAFNMKTLLIKGKYVAHWCYEYVYVRFGENAFRWEQNASTFALLNISSHQASAYSSTIK